MSERVSFFLMVYFKPLFENISERKSSGGAMLAGVSFSTPQPAFVIQGDSASAIIRKNQINI